MKKYRKFIRILILLIILILISIYLFISGKRHEITLFNNSNSEIKYSVEGEPYKSLGINKQNKFNFKGSSGVLFIKFNDSVHTIKAKMDISGDYKIYVKEALNKENYLEKIK